MGRNIRNYLLVLKDNVLDIIQPDRKIYFITHKESGFTTRMHVPKDMEPSLQLMVETQVQLRKEGLNRKL
jgi:hypothetical protein